MKDKYCSLVLAACSFTRRATLPALFVTAALMLNTSVRAQAPPGSLWYNGDFNGVGYHANGVNTSDPNSWVYDDFNVTGAWHLTAIFSDNLLSTVVTGADWEIRAGISGGNGGTLIASGTTSSPVVTATGRSGFGFNEFMVEITGINVTLAPGHYWLVVTPRGNGTGRSLDTTTSGTNCVGSPCGNDGNSWFNSGEFGSDDFSMGVIGQSLPEPATWVLLGPGLSALLIVARWRRSFRPKNRRTRQL